MANKKPKAASPPRLLTKKRMVLVVAGLLVLAVALVSYKTYEHQRAVDKQFTKDKANFAQAEKDMAAAYDEIVQKLGQPYETKISHGCGYGSVEFGRGSLACVLTYNFAFAINNSAESKKYGAVVKDATNNKNGFGQGITDYGISDIDKANGTYVSDLFDGSLSNCTLNYGSYTTEEYNTFQKDGMGLSKLAMAPRMATVSIECEKDVTKPLYKVEKTAN